MKRLMGTVFAVLLCGLLTAVSASAANAFEDLTASAENGDAVAQGKLGAMYYLGRGTEENVAEAVKWLRKAADQGVIEAQVMMAALHDIGRGVPQSYAEAAAWYGKAADQGHEPSRGILNYFKNDQIRATKALQIAKQYAQELLGN